jgi:hypothetical protein
MNRVQKLRGLLHQKTTDNSLTTKTTIATFSENNKVVTKIQEDSEQHNNIINK